MTSFLKVSFSFTLLSLFLWNSNADQVLLSPVLTNWGQWGTFENCPPGTFVKAFQLKTEPFKGPAIDDTCLNGIRFFCGDPLDGRTTVLTSRVGSWGVWGNVYSCNDGHVVGYQLRVERPHVVSDETATNNLRVFCSTAVGYYIEGDGNAFGTWSTAQICAPYEAACGILTQIQPDQGILLDDTAMNNVNVQCCNVTSNAAVSG